jgi:excisionase family DNA binding protein
MSAAAAREPLWTTQDVMKYLQVSRSWVYQRIQSNELNFARVGGLLRIEPQQVRDFALGRLPPQQARR